MPAPEPTLTAPTAGATVAPAWLRRSGARAAAAVDWLVAHRLAVLAALLVAHWIALAAFAFSIPHNGWVYYHGGDQIWLTTTGWLLADGALAPTYVGYGWPLLLAPILALTGPGFVAAVPAVVLLGALVLAPLALWAVYALAERVAGAAFGLLAALAWVVAPYAAIPLWREDYHERYVEQFLPQALGLTALADYVSMVTLLVAAVLLVRALDTRVTVDAVVAGAVTGLAIGTKPANSLFLAGPALALVVARRPRVALAYTAGLAPAVATLALWKLRGLGVLPAFALEEQHLAAAAAAVPALDRYVDLDWGHLHTNMNDLREYFWSARLLQWLPLAGLIAVGRRSLPIAALLAGWFGAHLVVKGTTELSTVASASFFRFLMPAFPAYFLLAVSVVLLVPTLGRRIAVRWPQPVVRRHRRRPLLVTVAALTLVAFAAVAVARPISEPRAIFVSNILTPVDDRIDVRVERDGEARLVSWSHAPVGSARVFYHLFRTGTDDGLECRDHGGALDCELRMISLGATREQTYRDGSPPPGVEYRVGIAANWKDDPNEGDVFLISPPVRAG